MALISSMLRSSEPGALLLLICLIVLVTSAGRTAGTGSTTILGKHHCKNCKVSLCGAIFLVKKLTFLCDSKITLMNKLIGFKHSYPSKILHFTLSHMIHFKYNFFF